uniref:Uncharacterized protein n=1 Tax=Vibrio splendidus TaxID=29497 RepID=A0A0H3ZUF9_VIBSP|nr:hypothetical protein [Vibrio splendidus]
MRAPVSSAQGQECLSATTLKHFCPKISQIKYSFTFYWRAFALFKVILIQYI